MQSFKHILFFLFTLLLCEALAIGASAWSFFESSLVSFQLLKISSDNRARDTISSLSKSTESKLDVSKLTDLNFTFTRLVKVTSEDKDRFEIKEISLVSDQGIVLASSNPDFVEHSLKKRKPESKFLSASYVIAHRLRKWQTGTPVLLGKVEEFRERPLLLHLAPFFPEILELDVLISMGVYHPEKLERIASLHMIYERGNFVQFVKSQTDLFLWIAQNNSWIALICALLISLVHMLVKSVKTTYSYSPYSSGSQVVSENRPNPSPTKKVKVSGNPPPLWEKADFSKDPGPLRWQSASVAESEARTPSVVTSTEGGETGIQEERIRSVPKREEVLERPMRTSHTHSTERSEILDAIYLG
ncbi:hypothetical protein CH373_09340 [Leptospira perolatii]|uniref:Uncharacterized protein n=1 Tax=Leptospira perolatii TaxID=2023191 RepID=A0A2M9ZM95_9LEPT|nr:hypothetical protein [Leptospira perolatii]PJZ68489.1 hypothetical protein CH360_15840 [Leptospira perolatii]PJZ73186.1 hypothetical protein CH373_09340 [Leptospira perolatii]